MFEAIDDAVGERDPEAGRAAVWPRPGTDARGKLTGGAGRLHALERLSLRGVLPEGFDMSFLELSTIGRARFAGLLVMPDVHAHPDALEAALARARAEGLFLLQLGELVDRGPSSSMAVALMREAMAEGVATFLIGNHEHKLAVLVGTGQFGTPGRVDTRDELEDYGDGLLAWYVERIKHGPLWARAPKLVAAHAAFHPEMLAPQPSISEDLRIRAMFGMRVSAPGKRRPTRSREWVDDIPRNVQVIVGHDVVSNTTPVTERGRRGGTATMLDTGGWREDGRWSSMTLTWSEVGL